MRNADRSRRNWNVARSAVLACGLALAQSRPAVALKSALAVSQYSHTAWTIRDGHFATAVVSIAQTPDGYLWLATELGLLRFDGVRIVPWQPRGDGQLPSTSITKL